MILVTGETGQLGYELKKLLPPGTVFLGREALDLADAAEPRRLFEKYRFTALVNTAAYTQVDQAEIEREKALAINAKAPGILSELCRKNGARFVHFSTDYVFNGESSTPYRETDPIDPINYYGQTKALGEKSVLDANPEALVLRTSWVYSQHGKNFVKTMASLGRDRDELKVVNDQIGSPTWALDLARVTKLALETDLRGVYHYSGEGTCSWYDFACAIKERLGFKARITPIPSSEFPTKAKRPRYSLLSKEKIKRDLGVTIPTWRESLDQMLSSFT